MSSSLACIMNTTRNAVYHNLSKIRPWVVNLRSSPKRGMGAFSRVVMFFSKICQPHKQVEENCLCIIIQINSTILLTSVTCCRTLSAKTSCSREISMTFPSICLTSSTSELICSKSCSFSCSNWQNNFEKKISTHII